MDFDLNTKSDVRNTLSHFPEKANQFFSLLLKLKYEVPGISVSIISRNHVRGRPGSGGRG